MPETPLLPDFRSLGVALRALIGGMALAAGGALVATPRLGDWVGVFVDQSIHVVPVLLGTLGFCALLARPLRRISVMRGAFLVIAVAALIAMAVVDALSFVGLGEGGGGALLRAALLASAGAAVLIGYFALRAKAMRPADAEARFAALSARIRPHFLFNSLNAVLSLIRSDPRRAETALESVAELFRVLMRDPRRLVPLSDEIAFCRQYLDLERLRLGDRLRVSWDVRSVPEDAQVPPLMLQPLLENAVYHGVEPADEGGEIAIRFDHGDEGIVIDLENPLPAAIGGRDGNHMALDNVRERLDLHFDLDARLETATDEGRFRVRIVIPYRTGG